jgi:putative pyruvate formate lyase activating enzyme
MPDFKIWDEKRSLTYLKAKDYPKVARHAIKEMHRQVGDLKVDENGLARRGVLVRHLVMPADVAGTSAIMRFLADELSPDTYVNLMDQYYPAGRVSKKSYGEINRRLRKQEYELALEAARDAGLWRFDRRQGGLKPSWY